MNILQKELLCAILGSSACPDFYFLDKVDMLDSSEAIRLHTDLNLPPQRREILAKQLKNRGFEEPFPRAFFWDSEGGEFAGKGVYLKESPLAPLSRGDLGRVSRKIQQIRDKNFFPELLESLSETEQYLFLDTIILSDNEIEEIYHSLPLVLNDIQSFVEPAVEKIKL